MGLVRDCFFGLLTSVVLLAPVAVAQKGNDSDKSNSLSSDELRALKSKTVSISEFELIPPGNCTDQDQQSESTISDIAEDLAGRKIKLVKPCVRQKFDLKDLGANQSVSKETANAPTESVE